MSCTSRTRPDPRWRRLGAALACVLWVLGFEIGPGLHVALHHAVGHHHHEGDLVAHEAEHELGEPGPSHAHAAATPHHAHGHPHAHGHASHHAAKPAVRHAHGHAHAPRPHAHAHPPASTESALAGLTPSRRAYANPTPPRAENLGHGRHALAHRGLAATPTPPAWPVIASVPTPVTAVRAEPELPHRSAQPRHRRARGPPATV